MKKRINGGNIYATLFADLVLIAASIYSLLSENTIDFAIFILSAVLLTVCSAIFEKKSRVSFSEYVKMITEKKEGMSGDAISKFPLPMAVLKINGQISWFNDLFSEMVDSSELYNVVISDIMPELRWSEILKSTGSIYTYASYKGHKYNVVGDIIKSDISTAENPDFTVLLYFIDKTETENLRKRYEDEKTDIAIINIDNYDEIFQKIKNFQVYWK